MKKILLLLLFVLIANSTLKAEGTLSVGILVPEGSIPAEAISRLETKLLQIATNYGMANDGMTDRFYLSANVLTTSKDIVPTTPPRVSMKLDVVLFFGDVVEGKLYGSCPISVVGVGQNDNKAFIQAFGQIPTHSEKLESFFTEMKNEVKAFFMEKGKGILREADNLAKKGEYDEALSMLLSIPVFCGDLSDEAIVAANAIYQKRIDLEAEKAKKEAEIAQEEKEFQLRQYEDDLELRRQQLKDQTSLEKARIDAMKEAAKKVNKIDIKKVSNIIKGWFSRNV